eukprot:SAG31_NODE_36535_length_312_cov_0.971831_1_plen_40_part_10
MQTPSIYAVAESAAISAVATLHTILSSQLSRYADETTTLA